MKMFKERKRLKFIAAFLLCLLVEVFIAIFIHDEFVRPYFGDILVVVTIYFFMRAIVLDRVKFLVIYIFLFAAIVELLQYANVVTLIGLQENQFARIIIGSVFDIKDIVCYGIGCIIVFFGEKYI